MSIGALLFLGLLVYATLDTINTVSEKNNEKNRR